MSIHHVLAAHTSGAISTREAEVLVTAYTGAQRDITCVMTGEPLDVRTMLVLLNAEGFGVTALADGDAEHFARIEAAAAEVLGEDGYSLVPTGPIHARMVGALR